MLRLFNKQLCFQHPFWAEQHPGKWTVAFLSSDPSL